MRIWYFACLLLLLYSIIVLYYESFEVSYKLDNELNFNNQYLECVYLNEIFKNQTLINLNQINYNYLCNFNEKINQSKQTSDFVMNRINSKNYLIFNEKICFINDNQTYYLNEFLHKSPTYYIFNRDTLKFFKYDSQLSLELTKVINLEHPYSKCRLTNNKFRCLTECVKRKYRLSKYYYHSNETGFIYLNYQLNKSILINERFCEKYCRNQIECQIDNFMLKELESNLKETIIKGYLPVDTLNYYIQLIGLIILVLNIPLNQLLIRIFMILNSRINLFKNVKLFKLLISFKNLILIFVLYFIIIADFIDKRYNNIIRKEIHINAYKFDRLNIVICVQLKELVNEKNDQKFKSKYRFRTFKELESITKFNNSLIDIYLKYDNYHLINKIINIKWKLKSNVYFLNYKRCYQIEIATINLKDYDKLSSFKLIIKIDYQYYNLFILSRNEKFNDKTYKHDNQYNFKEIIIKRSKFNKEIKCINYNDLNYKFSNSNHCNSKRECIDKCRIIKFYSESRLIHRFSVLNKDDFSDKQWNRLKLNNYQLVLNDPKINRYCYNKFPLFDCDQTFFKRQNQNKNTNTIENNEIKIKLTYDLIISIEEELSSLKLLLDLLNIQIIIFGLNSFQFISIIFKFLNLNFKHLINLICLIGFTYHLWIIFDQIINNDLIYIQYYKLEQEFKVPDLIFCAQSKQPNHSLNELEVDSLFEKFKYLNELNEWILIDKKTNYSDNAFKINKIIISDKSCFKIKFNLEYELDQFEFLDHRNILEIYFNESIIKQIQISFTNQLDNYFSEQTLMDFESSTFEITSQEYEISSIDKFKFFKNPLSILDDNENTNNIDNNLNNIVNNLEINFKKESKDNVEVDYLFKNYSYQTQTKFNNKRLLLINYLLEDFCVFETYGPNIIYRSNHFKHIILITNYDNFAKLLLNLINVLSFWTDKGVLDLHYYFFKINLASFFIKMYYLFLSKFNFKHKFRLNN